VSEARNGLASILYFTYSSRISIPQTIATMSQRKQERDFTAEVTALVAEVDGLAKVSSHDPRSPVKLM
jgi:hypothetical protein